VMYGTNETNGMHRTHETHGTKGADETNGSTGTKGCMEHMGCMGQKGADGTHWIPETSEQIGFLGLGLIYKIIISFWRGKIALGKELKEILNK